MAGKHRAGRTDSVDTSPRRSTHQPPVTADRRAYEKQQQEAKKASTPLLKRMGFIR